MGSQKAPWSGHMKKRPTTSGWRRWSRGYDAVLPSPIPRIGGSSWARLRPGFESRSAHELFLEVFHFPPFACSCFGSHHFFISTKIVYRRRHKRYELQDKILQCSLLILHLPCRLHGLSTFQAEMNRRNLREDGNMWIMWINHYHSIFSLCFFTCVPRIKIVIDS